MSALAAAVFLSSCSTGDAGSDGQSDNPADHTPLSAATPSVEPTTPDASVGSIDVAAATGFPILPSSCEEVVSESMLHDWSLTQQAATKVSEDRVDADGSTPAGISCLYGMTGAGSFTVGIQIFTPVSEGRASTEERLSSAGFSERPALNASYFVRTDVSGAGSAEVDLVADDAVITVLVTNADGLSSEAVVDLVTPWLHEVSAAFHGA
ncbi:hypothetical protein [Subtercola sp. YIM 133946]|uniref:hypothetical protein n=1 Tax=Subtercola sp. YIM 133946 TaxID=3118909 RepID=UPI002F92AD71